MGVEGIKEGEQIGGGGRPSCFEEQGDEPIQARTGIRVHMTVGQVDFIVIESSIEVAEGPGTLRVKILEMKVPVSRTRGAEEVQIGVEDCSLLVMVVHLAPIMFNDLDFVLTVPLIRASMEEACVFIPLERRSDFASLLPHQKLGVSNSAKNTDNDGP